jgi:succinate dehydrogenase / fumarate reductase membrane anchor subunit
MRSVSGAHYGVRDWLAQRFTALVLLCYGTLLAVRVARLPRLDYTAWHGLFEPAWMRHATLLCMVALCWHAWIGMRDIYMDYLRATGIRLAAHVLTLLALAFCLLWTADILWRMK